MARVTADENPIYYDIYVRGPNNEDVGKNRTGDGPYRQKLGRRDGTHINGLEPGKRYCFAIRARTEGGTKGCVSLRQSSWQCAVTRSYDPPQPCPTNLTCPIPAGVPEWCPRPACQPGQPGQGGSRCCWLSGPNGPEHTCGHRCRDSVTHAVVAAVRHDHRSMPATGKALLEPVHGKCARAR